jgi:curved DNA-binding protein CbpA
MSPRENARAILGVPPGASIDEITMAYRHLAADHHPDRGGDTERMAEINAARDALLAPEPIVPARRQPREPCTYSEYLHMHRRAM